MRLGVGERWLAWRGSESLEPITKFEAISKLGRESRGSCDACGCGFLVGVITKPNYELRCQLSCHRSRTMKLMKFGLCDGPHRTTRGREQMLRLKERARLCSDARMLSSLFVLVREGTGRGEKRWQNRSRDLFQGKHSLWIRRDSQRRGRQNLHRESRCVLRTHNVNG